jgi:hypothetical protein
MAGTVGILAAMFAFTTGAVTADPSTPSTLTYHFSDCTGPGGTPATFDAVKQPGGAAALHMVGTHEIFVAVRATDLDTGAILFTTPGFEHNDLPTVTCRLVHPVSQALELVVGMIAPIGQASS